MDIRTLTDSYSVAPQIDPEDMGAIKAAGFVAVICNRPDEEVPPSHQAAVMAAAAEMSGLTFHVLPIAQRTNMGDAADRQRDILEATDGPVLAYCASGTLCTIVWAVGQAGRVAAYRFSEIAGRAGYKLRPFRAAFGA